MSPVSGWIQASISPMHFRRAGFRRQVMFVRSRARAFRMVTHPTIERRKTAMEIAGPDMVLKPPCSSRKSRASVNHVPSMLGYLCRGVQFHFSKARKCCPHSMRGVPPFNCRWSRAIGGKGKSPTESGSRDAARISRFQDSRNPGTRGRPGR